MTAENLEQIQKELEEKAVRLGEINVLFLDISSSCTGYTIFGMDFVNKRVNAKTTGAIWFNSKMEQTDKCGYLYSSIVSYFDIVHKVDFVVAEAYMLNSHKMMGCLVSPELHGSIRAACSEVGTKFMTFPVQSWRKELGVKKNAEGDYKQPCKEKVLEYVQIPEEITSNITKKTRQTPSDIYDSMGLAIGFCKRLNFTKFNFSQLQVQEHVPENE